MLIAKFYAGIKKCIFYWKMQYWLLSQLKCVDFKPIYWPPPPSESIRKTTTLNSWETDAIENSSFSAKSMLAIYILSTLPLVLI